MTASSPTATASPSPATPGDTIDVLQFGPWLDQTLHEKLRPPFRLLPLWRQDDLMGYLHAHAGTTRAIVTHSGGRLPTGREVMQALPRLEIVVNLGSGMESVDLQAAQERNVRVFNGAGVNAVDVAELAMGMVIALGRAMMREHDLVRADNWPPPVKPVAHRVSGRPIGILGMGAIGREVARRAAAFDMPIAYHARRPVPDVPWPHMADPVELAHRSDFLVVALPGGAATRHLVNARLLDALGPRGYLVNVGRGSIVDEAALIQALQQGRIAGAGLDVYEREPEVPAALRQSDKVVLMPHRGGSTFEAFDAIADNAISRLRTHFLGA